MLNGVLSVSEAGEEGEVGLWRKDRGRNYVERICLEDNIKC